MIKTKFGNGRKRSDGYIQITTKPHAGKLLHRLVYESHFGPIPTGFVVHHVDGNKENNNITNLILLSKNNHQKLHRRLEDRHTVNHPRWNKGKIDNVGGVSFLSAEKNKGRTMMNISEELGYASSSTIFHYLDKRGLRWNEI